MKLKPLKQWVCDTCHETIVNAEHGWIEWLVPVKKNEQYGFRIVHHAPHSPKKPSGNCYLYDGEYERKLAIEDNVVSLSMHLENVVGESPLPFLLKFIDIGEYHEPEYGGPIARDLREWSELARRLSLPHYEEARLYWAAAEAGEYFSGANETWIYLPSTLRRLIEIFGD